MDYKSGRQLAGMERKVFSNPKMSLKEEKEMAEEGPF